MHTTLFFGSNLFYRQMLSNRHCDLVCFGVSYRVEMSQDIYVNCVQKVKKPGQMEMEEVYVNSDIIKCNEEPKKAEESTTKGNLHTKRKGKILYISL